MAISLRRAAAGFAPPSSAGRSNTAPTRPATSKPSTISTSSPPISSICQPSSAADGFPEELRMADESATSLVEYACKDQVATLTLNRPQRLNAFSDELVRHLAD